ncbi:MAG TPA: hypothetical protein VGU74_08305 [Gemmatimonadales bacterium]|nr:hypothetical protein [Gemmatimonadales bacterium]
MQRHVTLDVTVDYTTPKLSGSITYELENWTTRPAGEVSFIVNRLMSVSSVHNAAGRELAYTQDVVRFSDDSIRQVTQVRVRLPGRVPPGGRTTLRLDYAGYLVGYTEVGWLYVKDHIDTAFTIIREDALAFPVIGGNVNAANRKRPRPDFTYDAAVRVPSQYVVATGGTSTRTPHEDGTATWRYTSSAPSPFLNIAIAPFDTIGDSVLRVFYFRADSLGALRLMASAQTALKTFTQWFGPPHRALTLTITEIPDGFGSQASLVGGIIQTASAFRDPTHLGELYHELSHIWNARDTEHPSPRWNEGLATFLEKLMRERLDGWTGREEGYAQAIANMKTRIAEDSLLRRVPFIDYGKHDLTGASYRVGDLMFATMYDLLGEEQFNRVLGGYYQQFADSGTTRDFVAFAKRVASPDLLVFFDDWMMTPRWTERLAAAASIRDLASGYRSR